MSYEDLLKKQKLCNHTYKQAWDDNVLLGSVSYGEECTKCGHFRGYPPSPIALGVYK